MVEREREVKEEGDDKASAQGKASFEEEGKEVGEFDGWKGKGFPCLSEIVLVKSRKGRRSQQHMECENCVVAFEDGSGK